MEIFLTFPVKQQSFQVLDLCSAATTACHLIHGNHLNHRETFWAIHVLCSIDHRHPYQGILHSTTPSATGAIPVQVSTGRLVARGEERIGSTTTMPMSERRPSTMNSFYQRKSHRILWLDSKDYRYRSYKFSTPSSFLYWKIKIQNPSKFLFRFSLGSYVMDQRSGDGRFSG